MAKTDNWQRRKKGDRGFDDFPAFSDPTPVPSFARRPTPAPMAGGPETKAVVKWFNAEKGFGFVELSEGAGDVFLHASVLARLGVTSVNPRRDAEGTHRAGPEGSAGDRGAGGGRKHRRCRAGATRATRRW
ncbi:MAG: cold shock domain-containing protein [Rhodospirillales bacterium]